MHTSQITHQKMYNRRASGNMRTWWKNQLHFPSSLAFCMHCAKQNETMNFRSSRSATRFRKQQISRTQEIESHTRIPHSNPFSFSIWFPRTNICRQKQRLWSLWRNGIYLWFPTTSGDASEYQIFQTIFRHISKQARISFPSVCARILAPADASDRSLYANDCRYHITSNENSFTIQLTVDSFFMYSKIKSLDEGRDYQLCPTVARLRESLEAKEVSII